MPILTLVSERANAMDFASHLRKRIFNLVLMMAAGVTSYRLSAFLQPGSQRVLSTEFIIGFAVTYVFLGAYLNYLQDK